MQIKLRPVNTGALLNREIPALEFHNVSVAYGDALVLTDIDFTIPVSAFVAVLGPNGAGKSTLLRAALSLVPRCSGWIKIFGADLKDVRTQIAYVPQRESVSWDFPARALDVVLMGMFHEVSWFSSMGIKRRNRALEALDRMGMADMASRPLQQLSGGQQQRVFLARALVQDPKILFLDEPLAGIDVETEAIIIKTLKELCNKGATALVVHHDLSTVESYFDHVLMVNVRLMCPAGPTSKVFSAETIKATYGPRLSLLEEARLAARPVIHGET